MALCNCKSAGSGNYDFCEAIHGECQFTADGYDDGHICSIKNFIDMKLYDRYGPPRPPNTPPEPPKPYDAEVKYLESMGGQYINTGILFSGPCSIRIVASFTPTTSEMDMFGAYRGGSSIQMVCGCYNRFIFGYNAPATRIDSSSFEAIPTTFDISYTFADNGTRTLSVNGSSYANSSSYYNDIEITLFRSNFAGEFKCMRFEIRNANGILVRDMIPVRFTNELAQSEGAMYDRISGQLFRNAGTGDFIVGPDKVPWTNPYVTNDLVAMWDGEWNIDEGEHADKPTQIADLAGYSPLSVITSSAVEIGENYFAPNNNKSGRVRNATTQIAKNTMLSGEFTVECAFRCNKLDGSGYVFRFGDDGNTQLYSGNGYVAKWLRIRGKLTDIQSVGMNVGEFGTITIRGNDQGCSLFKNGTYMLTVQVGSATIQNGVELGYNTLGNWKIYSTRIYSRALSDDEIDANAKADQQRFNVS